MTERERRFAGYLLAAYGTAPGQFNRQCPNCHCDECISQMTRACCGLGLALREAVDAFKREKRDGEGR